MKAYERLSESATQARLLAAATDIFAESGYDGGSVRAITQRAGVNLGAVTYHFGSKAALFEAVLLRGVGGLLQALERAASAPGSALERLEGVVAAHFQHVADHPEMRRLMLQILAADRTIPETAVACLRRAAGLVGSLIAEGQLEGRIRKGDPRLLTVAVMAHPLMLNLLRPLLRVGPGVDLDDPETRGRALDNALRFVRAGLAPETGESDR